jgi:hypothetical protein
MTVEQELYNSLLMYPSIFPNRWSAYHHWFCVLGNGYEWVDGDLCYPDIKKYTITDAVKKHFKLHLEDESQFDYKSLLVHNISRCKQAILDSLNTEQRMRDFTQKVDFIYPLGKGTKLSNLPDDIKPDWEEAVMLFRKWLKDNYNTLSINNKKYVDAL